jgi:hypothetical protein
MMSAESARWQWIMRYLAGKSAIVPHAWLMHKMHKNIQK